ncbi:MAG TPA: class I SAM-dependent methyltransferase [Phycisphaerae bacterium]|nr:class I SAM-dependent methyltransferase [Phycisphaerae bacterium]
MERPSTLAALSHLRTRYIYELTKPEVLERFGQMCRERSDAEAVRCIFNNAAHEWIHSVGVSADKGLQAVVPPIPPQELRAITAAPEPEIFLWTGLVDITSFLAIYHHYKGNAHRAKVLDFGAGCGRMIRFLNDFSEKYQPFASDVNGQHMTWCGENLKGVTCFKNGTVPPFPEKVGEKDVAGFDLIYSLSVFTHLPEVTARKWMEEIHARLAPGGILIFTTHGDRALETICSSETHQKMFMVTQGQAEGIRANLGRERFVYLKYPDEILQAADAGSDYGNSFIHPDYVRREWGRMFEELEYIPGGLRGWQDVMVLRRRG